MIKCKLRNILDVKPLRTLGIVATLLGWMDPLGNLGQSGVFLLLYGAGQAAFGGMADLVAGNGATILRYLILVLYCFAVGLAGGFVLNRLKKSGGDLFQQRVIQHHQSHTLGADGTHLSELLEGPCNAGAGAAYSIGDSLL